MKNTKHITQQLDVMIATINLEIDNVEEQSKSEETKRKITQLESAKQSLREGNSILTNLNLEVEWEITHDKHTKAKKEELQILLSNAEHIFEEKNGARFCLMGDQMIHNNNNQVLKSFGSSTNEMRKLLKFNNIHILDLFFDDGTTHLTISKEATELLGFEIEEL